jgi:hypothetical protein
VVSDEARLHEMIAAACLGARSEEEFTADLAAFLAANGVAPADAEALLASPPRLALYRRLVRNNLRGVVEKMLGRTRARLNALGHGAFDETFSSFLDEVGPRTPYLRDVPGEMLMWALPRWRARSDLPRWAGDFARHELLPFQLGAARAGDPPPVTEVAIDRPLVLREPVRVARYAFAVHELSTDLDDRTEPREEATLLLAYRSDDDEVCFLRLHPFLAALTERLLAGAPLGDATRAAASLHPTPGEDLLGAVARYLADLGERGVLLGGAHRS